MMRPPPREAKPSLSLDSSHESEEWHHRQHHPVSSGKDAEAFVPGLGTIRECLDCGCLVAGGPTRCKKCAAASAPRTTHSRRQGRKCVVRGCKNHRGEGSFVGNLCYPCYHMLTTGDATGILKRMRRTANENLPENLRAELDEMRARYEKATETGAAAVEVAVAAERERCAKVVRDHTPSLTEAARRSVLMAINTPKRCETCAHWTHDPDANNVYGERLEDWGTCKFAPTRSGCHAGHCCGRWEMKKTERTCENCRVGGCDGHKEVCEGWEPRSPSADTRVTGRGYPKGNSAAPGAHRSQEGP